MQLGDLSYRQELEEQARVVSLRGKLGVISFRQLAS